jgi:hypothetical protein
MSLLSRLFRSKAQKAVDTLQENLNRRLLAIEGGLKLFGKATDAFDVSNIPEGSEDEASFKGAQAKHQYFTNALLDDLKSVEELIKTMQLDLGYNNGRPSPGFASEVIEAERMLEETNKNVDRLLNITQEMLDLADHTQRGKDFASLKPLLDNAIARKSDVDDTMAQLDKLLEGMIADYDETGTFSDPDLANKAAAFMKTGTALSLAEGVWIDFLQEVMNAPSIDPFRAEVGRKAAWLEERFKVYENARTEVQALLDDTVDEPA